MDYKEYKEDINLKLQKLDSFLERFMENITYHPAAYVEEYIKIGKKVLRDFDFTTLGNQKR